MLNRKSMKVGEQVERLVAAGVSSIEEGSLLCEIIEDGVAKVTVVAVPVGTEKLAGFAITPYHVYTSAVAAEQFVVPASGSLTFNLRNNRLLTGQSRALVMGGVDLTVDETNFAAAAGAGTVKVDILGGRIKFAAADAGKKVTFLYRHELSVQQAQIRYQERSINNKDLVGALKQVGVAKGYVEIATDQFDLTKDYTAATSLKLGANGFVTDQSGTGPIISQAKVLSIPDLTNSERGAYLKISALIG